MATIFIVFCFLIILLLSGAILFTQLLSWEMSTTQILKLIYNTLGRDLRAGFRFARVHYFLLYCQKHDLSIGKLFQRQVKKTPDVACFLFEDQIWTFQQVEDYSNQVANAFRAAGYKKGDEVALFMENRPEYVCIWLGLSKIGVIPALINTNLRSQTLVHSLNAVSSKAIIFNADLASAVGDVVPCLEKRFNTDYLCLDGRGNNNLDSLPFKSLDIFLQDSSKVAPDESKDSIGFSDVLFYIYTSGTTGLPKAAIIRHSRFVCVGVAAKFGLNLKDDEIAYNCLPLYHSAGGILFVSVSFIFGGTVAIRKKFSASNFWKDSIKYKATVSQYIGEICRYLLNQPEKPEDTQHNIRIMVGNGLRPQIWEEFQKRFHISKMIEIYAATEGNANLVNLFGKVGAVGFVSRLFSSLYPVSIIKVNPETGEPIRDKNGLCIRCKPGEPGGLVGKIVPNNPVNSFDGYANKSATDKKIIRNCFQKGDMAFHSGDILVMDEEGYLYFMDRTGDTFRWRGENVSANEVEAIISKVLSLIPCVVYGVEIPGTEGRAGMAAIQSEDSIDMKALHKGITSSLPTYAVPMFVRICKQIESTGTYKLKKIELQKEGFNPANISDPIFLLDAKTRSYVTLNEKTYSRIINGEIRL